MAVLLGVIAVGDSPALFSRARQQTMVLDRAITDEAVARDLLGAILDARIDRVTLRKVDMVSETTLCDVRFTLPPAERNTDDSLDAHLGSASSGASSVTSPYATTAGIR